MRFFCANPAGMLSALCSALFLAACAYAPTERIVANATDYNLAVEQANNQMLLLNVMRAMNRHPMYFTSISALRGSVSTEVSTGGLTIPFGGDAKNEYSVAPSATFATNPTFDLAVLDTEKFYRGVLTPVAPELLQYYADQGWPAELLLHMFVRTIKVGERTFVNYPGAPNTSEFATFQEVLKLVFNCGPITNEFGNFPAYTCDIKLPPEEPETKVGPVICGELGLDQLADLVSLQKEAFSLTRAADSDSSCSPKKAEVDQSQNTAGQQIGTRHARPPEMDQTVKGDLGELETNKVKAFQLRAPTGWAKLQLSDPDKREERRAPLVTETGKNILKECKDYGFDIVAGKKRWRPSQSDDKASDSSKPPKQEQAKQEQAKQEQDPKCAIFLRSTEAMIYYLGEVVRAYTERVHKTEDSTSKDSKEVMIHTTKGNVVPLFRVERRCKSSDQDTETCIKPSIHNRIPHLLEINYRGEEYFIPTPQIQQERDMAPRTMQVLTLVSQLFALHKSSEELPVTPFVSVPRSPR